MDNLDLDEIDIVWDEDLWDMEDDPEGLLWLIIVLCWMCRAQISIVTAVATISEFSLFGSSSSRVGNPSKNLINIRMRSQMEQLNKLLYNDRSSICTIRMDKRTFIILCNLLREVGLKETRYVTIEEMVVVFLNICAHCTKNRYQSTDWTRSGQTISKIFHKVLSAILKLYTIMIVDPEPVTTNCEEMPWKFFEGCLGALDGTHIKLTVSEEKKNRYRNRKGEISTNVLGVVDRFGRFTYVYPGWEGSAADSRVLRDAITNPNGFKVPTGKYYLVDSGYTNGPGFLSPFRGHRYHLGTFGSGHPPPSNHEEYFNWRHSQARSVVERAFGSLKNRWKILGYGSYYSANTVNKIIVACCILQNFIYKEMGTFNDEYEENEQNDVSVDIVDSVNVVEPTVEWTTWRLHKAYQMWNEWTTGHN